MIKTKRGKTTVKGTAKELKADLSIIMLTLRKAFSEEDILAAVHRGLADYNKATDAKAEGIFKMIKQELSEAGEIVVDEED